MDSPSNEPVSTHSQGPEPGLPRRDSLEDSDSTLTRKRPRLDSGASGVSKAMTEEGGAAAPAAADAPQTPERNDGQDLKFQKTPTSSRPPSQVTINIKNQIHSSPIGDASTDAPEPVMSSAVASKVDDDARSRTPASPTPLPSPPLEREARSPGSSPAVQLELVADDDNTDKEYKDDIIHMDEDSADDIEQFWNKFPAYGSSDPNRNLAIIADHILDETSSVNTEVIYKLARWLDSIPSGAANAQQLFYAEAEFWDNLAVFIWKLYSRRTDFADEKCSWETEQNSVQVLLKSYLRAASRLIETDVNALESETLLRDNPKVLSVKHFKCLIQIFCGFADTNLYNVLRQSYKVRVTELAVSMALEFCGSDINGMHHLTKFACLGRDAVSVATMRTCLNLIDSLVTHHQKLAPAMFPAEIFSFVQDTLEMFQALDSQLQQVGRVLPVDFNRDCVNQAGRLLEAAARMNEPLALELASEHLGSVAAAHGPEYLPALTAAAWKFKIFLKYVVKGRMELRVTCVVSLDMLLVEIYSQYNNTEQGYSHPVMQYLAQLLRNEKVVDYILGEDSHPQIISRSANIIGFLVVTRCYSKEDTDKIWRRITVSPDSHVVAAIFSMVKNIVNLMGANELCYLCEKFESLPENFYNTDSMDLFREMMRACTQKTKEILSANLSLKPYSLCITVIENSFPRMSRASPLYTGMYNEAIEQLRFLVKVLPSSDKPTILDGCIERIKNRTKGATGCIHSLWVQLRLGVVQDIKGLADRDDLVDHLVEELCAFVVQERNGDSRTPRTTAMTCRLDLLTMIINNSYESTLSKLSDALWDHLIGKDAVNNHFRDLAWQKFCDIAQMRPNGNAYLERILEFYVPSLQPAFFTAGLFEFVSETTETQMRKAVFEGRLMESPLEIPGAAVLWKIILTAPEKTIEQQAAQLLASRYLEASTLQDTESDGSNGLHVKLAQKCVQQLLDAYSKLRQIDMPHDEMDTTNETEQNVHVLCYERTLLFMGIYLQNIKSRTDLFKKPRQDSKIAQSAWRETRGENVTFRYQTYDGGAGAIEQLTLGKENTLADLKDSISRRTGFKKFTAYTGGAPLKLDELPEQTIDDTRILGLIIVKRDPSEASSDSLLTHEESSSAFGEEVEKSFDKIYECLESSHRISAATYQFLTHLPISGSIASAVLKDDACATDIFPLKHPFKVRYACTALQSKLQTYLNKGVADGHFIGHTIKHLVSVLCDDTLMHCSFDRNDDFDLVSMLVNTIVVFLKERPPKDMSASYFPSDSAFVDRMLHFIHKARAHERSEGILLKCYMTILEAALHSQQIWLTFTERKDVFALHESLLLTDPRSSVRLAIAKCIEGVCGAIQSAMSLEPSAIISFYWALLYAIVPQCAAYPTQCMHVLELADFVFHRNFQILKNEEGLRNCLQSWGRILLDHKHVEFVGKDDVDEVVLGLTKLSLSCVHFLKSFKKPLEAGDLMESIFKKFLFLPVPENLSSDELEKAPLPVLESKTRTELYDLVLALSEDLTIHRKLMELTKDLAVDEAITAVRGFMYDRNNEIRSSTGYVGIHNPRNICYLNSLLTQFFMNLKFREFMLRIDTPEFGQSQRLLVETKRLFANLQNSYRRASDPRDFAETVRSIDGNPIDISIQMDADEFCNLLLDQWEGQIQSGDAKKAFRSFYGGQTVNQIKSYECEHVSERVEGFSVIQCDVRGHTNLTNSLEAFVKGDVMEGVNKYKCESCGGKFVKALKRTCLKDLPDNIIFQLKRFEFDLTNMTRAKVDDYFEFPEQIDVSPYKIGHLNNPTEPTTPDLYNLVGVLIHSGTAEGGHYYSFIRERPITSSVSSGWLNFNDRDVTELDPKDIPAFSFGGCTEETQYQASRMRLYNAYMLFYQRAEAMDTERRQFEITRTVVPPKVPIPEELENEISADNEILLRDHCLFDPVHSAFVRRLMNHQRKLNNNVCSENHEDERLAMIVCLQHYHEVNCRIRDNSDYEILLRILKNVARACPRCSNEAISYFVRKRNMIVDLFLKCPLSTTRTATRMFMLESLHNLRENDPVAYGVDVSDADKCLVFDGEGALCTVTSHFEGIMRCYLELNLKAWNDFFETLCIISNWGPSEGAIFLQNDMLYRCLQIFSCHYDAASREVYPTLSRMMDRRKWLYNRLIEFVYRLLGRVDLTARTADHVESRVAMVDASTMLFPLTRKEKQLLKAWHAEERCLAVLGRICDLWDSRFEINFLPGDIVTMMVGAEPQFGLLRGLFDTIYQGIKELQPQFADPYIKAAISFCDACNEPDLVLEIIRVVARNCAQLHNQVGGEVHLRFISDLMAKKLSSGLEMDFGWPHCYRTVLETSSMWAMALMMYDDDFVRQRTAQFMEYLLFRLPAEKNELMDLSSASGIDFMQLRFHVIRRLLNMMMKRIKNEHDEATSRNFMQPMISLCERCALAIQDLAQGEDEEKEAMRDAQTDSVLISRFNADIQTRLEIWQVDEDTVLSGNEAMDGSDFESDSDAYPEDVNAV